MVSTARDPFLRVATLAAVLAPGRSARAVREVLVAAAVEKAVDGAAFNGEKLVDLVVASCDGCGWFFRLPAAGQGGQQQEAEGEAGHRSAPYVLARRTSSSVMVCSVIFSTVKNFGWQNLRAQSFRGSSACSSAAFASSSMSG